jgi:hypothetical protein
MVTVLAAVWIFAVPQTALVPRMAPVPHAALLPHAALVPHGAHEATVVTLFLLSSVNQRLRPKLLRDLKAGTRVVSNTFTMGDWKPDQQTTVEGMPEDSLFSRKLYLWVIPQREPPLPRR